MSLVQPGALWALAVLPIILLLYILRPRHQRLVVPSVRLWQHLPSDLEGRPRWRLPPLSLLMLAQLAIAGGLVFALTRPARSGPVRQHLILLVDTSPSMLATDVAPTRLAAAIQRARDLIGAIGPDDEVTLIDVEPTPRILGSGKGPHAVDGALAKLTPSPTRGDVVAALLLASQTAQLSKDSHNRIVLLSDGAFGNLSLQSLGVIPADVSFEQVGTSDDHQAITALSARPMIGAVSRYVGFVQLTNYAGQDRQVTFQASADGLTIDRQPITLPARGHVEVSLDLPIGTRRFAAAIAANDVLSTDHQAEIVVPQAQTIPVTLVSASPSFWQRALKTLPTVKLSVVDPTAYKPDGAPVTILDNFVPATPPSGNVLLIAPPRGNPLVPVSGDLQNLSVVRTDPNSTLFDAVDLAGLYVPHAERFGAVSWATSVADSTQGPLILAGQQNNRQVVVIGFDPSTTDWPQRLSFPVFVANLIDQLTPTTLPDEITAGTVLDLPATTGVKQVLVQLPDGKVDVFAGGGPIRFADTAQVGRYVVSDMNGAGEVAHHEFVADRLGVAESNVAPQLDPTQISAKGSPAGQPSQHEFWPWVAGGALALLGAEWLLYFRRVG